MRNVISHHSVIILETDLLSYAINKPFHVNKLQTRRFKHTQIERPYNIPICSLPPLLCRR